MSSLWQKRAPLYQVEIFKILCSISACKIYNIVYLILTNFISTSESLSKPVYPKRKLLTPKKKKRRDMTA